MKTEYICPNCKIKLYPKPEVTERYQNYLVITASLECPCGNIYSVGGVVYYHSFVQMSHWQDQPELLELDDNLNLADK